MAGLVPFAQFFGIDADTIRWLAWVWATPPWPEMRSRAGVLLFAPPPGVSRKHAMAHSGIRSGNVRPPQYEQALIWAKKALDDVDRRTETPVGVWQPITGNRTRIF